jgi:hypothetical protein
LFGACMPYAPVALQKHMEVHIGTSEKEVRSAHEAHSGNGYQERRAKVLQPGFSLKR